MERAERTISPSASLPQVRFVSECHLTPQAFSSPRSQTRGWRRHKNLGGPHSKTTIVFGRIRPREKTRVRLSLNRYGKLEIKLVDELQACAMMLTARSCPF